MTCPRSGSGSTRSTATPRVALAGHAWDPLVVVDASSSARRDMDFERVSYRCDLWSAEKLRAGVNHYGYYFLIALTAADVEVSLLGDDGSFEGELDASMRMLARLARDARAAFRWSACSVYEDSGERSVEATGTAADLLALLGDG